MPCPAGRAGQHGCGHLGRGVSDIGRSGGLQDRGHPLFGLRAQIPLGPRLRQGDSRRPAKRGLVGKKQGRADRVRSTTMRAQCLLLMAIDRCRMGVTSHLDTQHVLQTVICLYVSSGQFRSRLSKGGIVGSDFPNHSNQRRGMPGLSRPRPADFDQLVTLSIYPLGDLATGGQDWIPHTSNSCTRHSQRETKPHHQLTIDYRRRVGQSISYLCK